MRGVELFSDRLGRWHGGWKRRDLLLHAIGSRRQGDSAEALGVQFQRFSSLGYGFFLENQPRCEAYQPAARFRGSYF